MGLDMYAVKVPKGETCNGETVQEFAYWRKNNALHGWMENLYHERGGVECFNCIPLQLEEADLERLRADIQADKLKPCVGFFFGAQEYSSSQKFYDLAFIDDALNEIADGFDVYYNSWW